MATHDSNGKRAELERRRARGRTRLVVAVLTAGLLAGAGTSYILLFSDQVAPTVLAVDPADGTILTAGPRAISLTFSEPLREPPTVLLEGAATHLVESTAFDGSTWTGSVVVPEGGDGLYFLVLEGGRDAAGHRVTASPIQYEVDATPPSSRAAVGSSAVSGSFDASWTATDLGSGVASVELWTRVNGAGWTMVLASQDATGTHTVDPGTQDADVGLYTVSVDRAGNREAAPALPDATVSFELSRATLVPLGTYWHVAPAVLSATAPSTVESVALAYSHSSDNVTWSPGSEAGTATGPFSWTFPFPDGPGHYRMSAIATDGEGRREPLPGPGAAEILLGYDDEPPAVSLQGLPAYWTDEPIVLAAEANDTTSGVSSVDLLYAYRPRGTVGWSAWTSLETRPGPGAFTFGFPEGEGHYSLHARATDRAGNRSPVPNPNAADVLVGYNRLEPVAPTLLPPRDLTGPFKTINWTFPDTPDLNRFEVHRSVNPSFEPDTTLCSKSATCVKTAAPDARSALFSLPLSDVTYYFRVRAVDEEGRGNVSRAVGALRWGPAYDTAGDASGAVDLPTAFSWSESLTDGVTCLDGEDWFRVELAMPGGIKVTVAVDAGLDIAITILDPDLQVVSYADAGGSGAWETAIGFAGVGVYYVVVSTPCSAPAPVTGWYTVSLG